MHRRVAELLEKRGIVLPSEQEAFLHPDFQRDLQDGRLMKGMPAAVRRLRQALDRGEHIAIFGDYDADGVPATALLVRVLSRLGGQLTPIIPTRSSGYGLTGLVVDDLIARGTQLLVTVDNGTVAKEEIARLAEAGIDTIVCDHHQPQEGHLAERALAILNPKQADCPYPFKELCGCAIAWKLAYALHQELGLPTDPLKWELDLVAFSTIADMVPLLGENRLLAICGLKVLAKSRNRGLRELAAVAGVELAEVNSGSVGFRLAPRVNAPSRMHREEFEGGNAALRLLTTDDQAEARRLAAYLGEQNQQRQGLLEQHLKEAEVLAQDCQADRCLVVYSQEWSSGVIGLVAGRLLEKYQRPVIVLASEGGQVKGSVRSVEGVNAVALVEAGAVHLERFGGHGKAAGLTLRAEASVTDFRRLVNDWMREGGWELEQLAALSHRPADLTLPLAELDEQLAEAFRELEPFGVGFPAPLLQSRCQLRSLRRVGNQGQHLSCQLVAEGRPVRGIGFGLGRLDIAEGGEYTVYYTLALESWNGRQSLSCQIQRLEA